MALDQGLGSLDSEEFGVPGAESRADLKKVAGG